MKKFLIAIAGILTALAGGYSATQIGSNRLSVAEVALLNASTATSTMSNTVISSVDDFKHATITLSTTAATATVQFACAMSETAPDFSAAKSETNRWDYVDVTDLEDGSSIDGDTGIALTNTTDVRQFELNVDSAKWCTALNTAYTSGTISAHLRRASNE